MRDDQLCLTREPIEQLISVELFTSCVPPLASAPLSSLAPSDHIIIAKRRDLLHNYPACFALLSLKERDILHTLLKFRAT